MLLRKMEMAQRQLAVLHVVDPGKSLKKKKIPMLEIAIDYLTETRHRRGV
jgi:hypothetical protein